MARLTIYKDSYVDSTVVSNCFIDDYMKDANDAQLKVYLYLIRMLNASQATSVSDIADKFNHTEKEVMRALKYWENQQLLSLDYDGAGSLVGIHLRDLTREDPEGASPLVHMNAKVSTPNTQIPIQAYAPVPAAVAGQSPDFIKERSLTKPSYSLDQLREFRSREETAQLLFIAESYLGRPMTPAEIKTMLYFTDVLHFSDDLIDYLIQYCVDRGKKDFKYIEKVALNWAEAGITTPRQAQKLSTKYDKNVYAIMNELGKNGSPTPKELEYITRWTRDYGFTNDIIFEACERTVMATDKHRFEYAESILSNWKRAQVHQKADISKMDDLYQQRRKTSTKSAANKFNQFAQNSYDFDELEKELLSN